MDENSIVESGVNVDTVEVEEINTPDTNDNINEVEPQEELDLDNLVFEEEHIYNGYDLSEYKDIIDNEEDEDLINSLTSQMKELGYNPEQAKFLMKVISMINEEDSEETEQLDTTKVKEDLNKYLNKQEKRNYKVVANYINQVFEGTELQGYVNDIKSNPFLVKMFNVLYTKSNSTQKITTANKQQPSGAEMTTDQAINMYTEWLNNQETITEEDRNNFVKSLINKSKNKKEIQALFNAMF